MRHDALLDDDADLIDSEQTCRHWSSGACTETCACGHGCAEHHAAGWCSRCGCLSWVDGPEALPGPVLPLQDDGWELADLFDDEAEPYDDYDDAAGF